MFNYTTTTVINDSVWEGEKNARFAVQSADEEKNIPASLNVKGVGIFKVPNITAIYKAKGSEGTLGLFSFDLPTSLDDGDKLRLSFTIALSQVDNDSLYSNDYSYKGKKFYIDFTFTTNATETAKLVEKMVNQTGLNIYGRKLWKLIGDKGNITVMGVVPSQRFRDVMLEKIELNKDYGREETVNLKPEIEYVDGVDDFMTYDWVLRNLRLPTYTHTRFAAEHKHENPIEGAIYNQYTIHYCAKRGQLGLNAVGQEVKSTTTHVFIVRQEISKEFEDALNEILTDSDIEIIEVP